jgi:hypothetical protein
MSDHGRLKPSAPIRARISFEILHAKDLIECYAVRGVTDNSRAKVF